MVAPAAARLKRGANHSGNRRDSRGYGKPAQTIDANFKEDGGSSQLLKPELDFRYRPGIIVTAWRTSERNNPRLTQHDRDRHKTLSMLVIVRLALTV
jgi:hypothetical protein